MPLHRYLEGISLIQPTQKERLSQMAKNRIEIVAAIEQAYEQPGFPYGAFSDVEDTLRQIVVKRNKAGQVSVVDCSSCSETMRIPYGVDRIAKEAFLGQSDLVTGVQTCALPIYALIKWLSCTDQVADHALVT